MISCITTLITSCGLSLSRWKKSIFLLSSFICIPALILCALVTIWLSAACLKIWLSFTTLQKPDFIMSFNTLPGPTDGSWFASPAIIRRVPGTSAFKSAWSRYMSTIENSSTIITSASSGCNSFLSKCIPPPSPPPPFTPSSLCTVCASLPDVSDILLAALPVGAARSTSSPSSSSILIIVLIVVVLPVPGPPVIISTPSIAAWYTACFCNSSRIISFCWFSCVLLSSSAILTGKCIFKSKSILAQFNSI